MSTEKNKTDSLTAAESLQELARSYSAANGNKSDVETAILSTISTVDASFPARGVVISIISEPELKLSPAILLRAAEYVIAAGDGYYLLPRFFGYHSEPEHSQHNSMVASLDDNFRLAVVELFGKHNDQVSLEMLIKNTCASNVVKARAQEVLADLKTAEQIERTKDSTISRADIYAAFAEMRRSHGPKNGHTKRSNGHGQNGNGHKPTTLGAAHTRLTVLRSRQPA